MNALASIVERLPRTLRAKVKEIHYARKVERWSMQEEPDLEVVSHLVKPGDNVIDVGANVGIYTRALSEMVGDRGAVFSVEPVPETFEILQSNIHRARLENVRLFRYAASDRARTVTLEIPAHPGGGTNFYRARISGSGETAKLRHVSAQTMRLEALIPPGRPISFIKVDVEGHELECLRGAARLLEEHRPALLVEVSGNPSVEGTPAFQTFRLLRRLGYIPFFFRDGRLYPYEEGVRTVNTFFLMRHHVSRLEHQGLLIDDRPRGEPGRVSVIITCYNYAAFLPSAIRSALGQTYQNLEVIVVDDGSTDDTPVVMKEFVEDGRVTYVRQSNMGQAGAKNTGIQLAQGEYVAFLDADDIWLADKLERQMPLLQNEKVGVVFSRKTLVDREGKLIPDQPSSSYLRPAGGWVTPRLFFDNFIPFSSAVVRRNTLDQAGWMDESLEMSIDWDLWLRLSLLTEFAYVDEALVLYRVGHDGQMSSRATVRQRCAEQVMKTFLRRHPAALSSKTVRQAWTYTYCNRGRFFQSNQLGRSTSFFLKALRNGLLNPVPYRGLAQNAALYIGLGRRGKRFDKPLVPEAVPRRETVLSGERKG